MGRINKPQSISTLYPMSLFVRHGAIPTDTQTLFTSSAVASHTHIKSHAHRGWGIIPAVSCCMHICSHVTRRDHCTRRVCTAGTEMQRTCTATLALLSFTCGAPSPNFWLFAGEEMCAQIGCIASPASVFASSYSVHACGGVCQGFGELDETVVVGMQRDLLHVQVELAFVVIVVNVMDTW